LSGLEHYFEVSGLAFSLLTSHSHAHKFYDWQTIPGVDGFSDSMSVRGLPRMVIDSVNRCDVDIRKELFSNILVKTQLQFATLYVSCMVARAPSALFFCNTILTSANLFPG